LIRDRGIDYNEKKVKMPEVGYPIKETIIE